MVDNCIRKIKFNILGKNIVPGMLIVCSASVFSKKVGWMFVVCFPKKKKKKAAWTSGRVIEFYFEKCFLARQLICTTTHEPFHTIGCIYFLLLINFLSPMLCFECAWFLLLFYCVQSCAVLYSTSLLFYI